jgi:hypothetical protein
MIRIGILLFFLLGAGALLAQPRFGAGIVAGLNASQIQGDDNPGFNKLGIRGGLRGIVRLDDRSSFGLDLLYSQRGATSDLLPNNTFLRFIINTEYIEVPVWFAYNDWLAPDGYYRLQGLVGLGYGRLFNARVTDHPFPEDQVENFSKNDISIYLGALYRVSRKFSLGVNYSRSIIPLYNNRKYLTSAGIPIYKHRLWGYFLSFESVFEF